MHASLLSSVCLCCLYAAYIKFKKGCEIPLLPISFSHRQQKIGHSLTHSFTTKNKSEVNFLPYFLQVCECPFNGI